MLFVFNVAEGKSTPDFYDQKIKILTDRADYYKEKSANQKDKFLKKIYRSYSEAKQTMVNGYIKMNKSEQKCDKIFSSNPAIKLTALYPDARNSNEKNIQKSMDICLQNIQKAEQNGNDKLINQYNEIIKALQLKTDGLELISEGKKEYRNTRNKLLNRVIDPDKIHRGKL